MTYNLWQGFFFFLKSTYNLGDRKNFGWYVYYTSIVVCEGVLRGNNNNGQWYIGFVHNLVTSCVLTLNAWSLGPDFYFGNSLEPRNSTISGGVSVWLKSWCGNVVTSYTNFKHCWLILQSNTKFFSVFCSHLLVFQETFRRSLVLKFLQVKYV